MSENYLSNLERRIDADLSKVVAGTAEQQPFVRFVCEEVHASFQRGLQAGRSPRKTAPRKRNRSRR